MTVRYNIDVLNPSGLIPSGVFGTGRGAVEFKQTAPECVVAGPGGDGPSEEAMGRGSRYEAGRPQHGCAAYILSKCQDGSKLLRSSKAWQDVVECIIHTEYIRILFLYIPYMTFDHF